MYATYEYYTATFGGSECGDQKIFKRAEAATRLLIDRYTCRRIPYAIKHCEGFVIPDEIMLAQCVMIDEYCRYEASGGAAVASETVSKHSVTYRTDDRTYEERQQAIFMGYLGGSPWLFRGKGVYVDTGVGDNSLLFIPF